MKDAKAWLLSAVAVFTPIHAAMATALALIFVDLVTGVLAAHVQKDVVTSYTLKKTVVKVLVYELAIVISYVIGQYLTGPTVPILQMTTSVIGLSEAKSIFENLYRITGIDVLSLILDRMSASSKKDAGGPREGE
jgi:phage-related holin